jgi:2-dehydro-3-deoxyphosphogluconate aldolase/(4S)-4-hydroxy-2-oxoglutarate aldolase
MAETLEAWLKLAPVVPVLTIDRAEDAVPLARALVAGGLPVLEVTLRTGAALEAIRRIAGEVEGAVPAAGTVLTAAQRTEAARAGAKLAVSPGLTAALAEPGEVPLLPGVATASEVMSGLDADLSLFKLFPATAVGGAALLRALAAPLPQARFCPTGGINAANEPDFLSQPNVVCVGGAWVAPAEAIRDGDWDRITALAREAAALQSKMPVVPDAAQR